MFAFLEAFFVEYGYAAVFFVLVICGFGVPIPEDLTLVTGGVISGMGYTIRILCLQSVCSAYWLGTASCSPPDEFGGRKS